MRDRPFNCTPLEIRALLENRKTQARRVVNNAPAGSIRFDVEDDVKGREFFCALGEKDGSGMLPILGSVVCPYGQPGDLLWVREACRAHELTDEEAKADAWGLMERMDSERPCYGLDGVVFAADNHFEPIKNTLAASEAWSDLSIYRGGGNGKPTKLVPPRSMPRWASRLTLRITDVRVERLHKIDEAAVIAEGVRIPVNAKTGGVLIDISSKNAPCRFLTKNQLNDTVALLRAHFASQWDDEHGTGAWAANSWTWVLTFEVLKRNVDAVLLAA